MEMAFDLLISLKHTKPAAPLILRSRASPGQGLSVGGWMKDGFDFSSVTIIFFQYLLWRE